MAVVAVDPFPGFAAPDGPYNDALSVTTSDTDDFISVASALFVATAQTALTVITARGTTLALGAVPAGTTIRLRVRRVKTTGTSPGTGITAFF